ncbi:MULTISPECIES: TadE/TadG family type IV pilus assembly protein [unclassified Isoptericola]|uniref:TadE/TadG family type IV pilus assembly protein n=1 Tax=unclassified Isoptericola TaxID=2623355 RepID=UPI00364EE47C
MTPHRIRHRLFPGHSFLRPRDERGSASIEAVIGAPVFALFLALVIAGGRIALAHQDVQAVAADAARAASLARTVSEANDAAARAMATGLTARGLSCESADITLVTAALSHPAGIPGAVSATVTCTVDLTDITLPGVPGAHTVTATMTSPVDTWRADP